MAWALSAMFHNEKESWDLWMIWSNVIPHGYERLPLSGNIEYRVYDRIPKKNIWYVGTRIFIPRRK